MGFFSRFERRMEDTVEGAANKIFDSPISPVQIAKKAEKEMRREKMVGAGKQYAPTLYTVLVNAEDDSRLFGYYPTLAGETETYLSAKAADEGLVMDGQPLVRFIVDEGLRRGKFEVIAELVAAPIVGRLREEEKARYGLGGAPERQGFNAQAPQTTPAPYGEQQLIFDGEADYLPDFPGYTPDSQSNNGKAFEQGAGSEYPGFIEEYGENYPEKDHEDLSVSFSNQNGRANDHLDSPNTPFPGLEPQTPEFSVNNEQSVAPNTVVFAPGAGNARPIPNRSLVRARLMDTSNKKIYDLATSRLLIGRDSTSDIVIDDINASRAHAEIRFEPQGVWVLSDLGSTNGTFVNGLAIDSKVLEDGDYLTIGTTNYLFVQAQ